MVALGLDGESITQVTSDYTVSIRTTSGYEVRIESDFTFRSSEGAGSYTPGVTELDPDALLEQRVAHAAVGDSGALTISFQSGDSLRVEPDSSYEAWTFAGPNGLKVVCMPGGELVTWSAETS